MVGWFLAGSSYSLLLSRCNSFSFLFLLPFIERKELTKQPPVISTDEFKNLLELTRECILNQCNSSFPKAVLQKVANETASCTVTSGKYCYLEITLLLLFSSIFMLVVNFLLEEGQSFNKRGKNRRKSKKVAF